MLRDLWGLRTNDVAVKAIFDHYKNLATAAVIVAVGIKVFEGGGSGIPGLATRGSGLVLIVIGAFLGVLNEMHGSYKLRKAKIGIGLFTVGVMLHASTAGILLLSLVTDKVPNLFTHYALG